MNKGLTQEQIDEARKFYSLEGTVRESIREPLIKHLTSLFYDAEKCERAQFKNNIKFVRDVGIYIWNYLEENVKPLDKLCTCKFSCNCWNKEKLSDRLFSILDKFTEEVIKESLAEQFTADLSEDEARRLSAYFREVFSIVMYRELSVWCFKHEEYRLSMHFHKFAIMLYGMNISEKRINSNDFISNEMSKRGKKAASLRWSEQKQIRYEKKKKFLQIMKDKEFTTYSDAAEYIKLNLENQESPEYKDSKKKPLSYATIERWLSQANKGDFS